MGRLTHSRKRARSSIWARSQAPRQSAAHAINDSSQVVGASETAAGTQSAFAYSDGVLRDLNTLIPASAGRYLAEARDTNNSGTIIGVGLRAFRLALAQ